MLAVKEVCEASCDIYQAGLSAYLDDEDKEPVGIPSLDALGRLGTQLHLS